MAGLLRICTAGSVDDGKSTLIGRLLYDAKGVYEDQVRSVTHASVNRSAGPIDFSLFTDGLRAEREQGITIDVAYRYFATSRRKFILADTPGHEQYTRNMATGASTADVAVLLADARYGLRPQSRRHADIARLLGISTFVIAVNKMDLVEFDRHVFEQIQDAFARMLTGAAMYAIPISAVHGDNVTTRSVRTPWFDGPPLLEHLETVAVGGDDPTAQPFRCTVQLVLRKSPDFRGYAGRIQAGTIRAGDEVAVWPSGRTARISRIVTWAGDLAAAHAPMSVTFTLDRDLDIGRGDVIAAVDRPPLIAERFAADVVWMDERGLEPGRVYLLKHGARIVTAEFDQPMALNEIARVVVSAAKPLAFDRYRSIRGTGAFIIIDPTTNFTTGAGMMVDALPDSPRATRFGMAERLAQLARAASTEQAAADALRDALQEILV